MRRSCNSLTSFWLPSLTREGSTSQRVLRSSNATLARMHGVELAEIAKLVPTLQQMYGLNGNEAF